MADTTPVRSIHSIGSLADAYEKRRQQLVSQTFTYSTLENELKQRGVEGISVTFERLDVDGEPPRILVIQYHDARSKRSGTPHHAHLIIVREQGSLIEFHQHWEEGVANRRHVLIPSFSMTGGTIPDMYRDVDLSLLLTTAFGLSNVPVEYEGDILDPDSFDRHFQELKSFFTGAHASSQDVTTWLQGALRALEKRPHSD